MGRESDGRKRLLLSILAVLLTVCLLFLGFRIFLILDQYYGRVDTSDDDAYAYRNDGRPEYMVNGKWYVQKEQVETYLLIGIDKYEAAIQHESGYRNNQQSDALFLIAVDRGNKSYSIVHINRDTMANIRMLDVDGNPYNTFEGQLALSHTYGSGREDSCENTVWSVSDYLYGLQIDHYASLSMDAIAVLNDRIGGVTLTVEDDMTPVDPTLQKGATVTLKGELALKFVRARGKLADSTNLSRMRRQRQYINAFLEQARSAAAADAGSSDLLRAIDEYLISDLKAEGLLSLSDVLQTYSFGGITAIEGTARKGEEFMEFYTDEAALQQLILDVFYEEK